MPAVGLNAESKSAPRLGGDFSTTSRPNEQTSFWPAECWPVVWVASGECAETVYAALAGLHAARTWTRRPFHIKRRKQSARARAHSLAAIWIFYVVHSRTVGRGPLARWRFGPLLRA